MILCFQLEAEKQKLKQKETEWSSEKKALDVELVMYNFTFEFTKPVLNHKNFFTIILKKSEDYRMFIYNKNYFIVVVIRIVLFVIL